MVHSRPTTTSPMTSHAACNKTHISHHKHSQASVTITERSRSTQPKLHTMAFYLNQKPHPRNFIKNVTYVLVSCVAVDLHVRSAAGGAMYSDRIACVARRAGMCMGLGAELCVRRISLLQMLGAETA
jgi:hypothetical protein